MSKLGVTAIQSPPSPADVLAASADPEGGEHTPIARFEAGTASCRIERYDYLDDGNEVVSELGVLADWPDEGAGFARLHLIESNFAEFDDLCAVLISAQRFITGSREAPG